MTIIDIFSRYAWVQPLKDKGSNEVINVFDKILQEGRKPKHLRTDAGREFTNNSFQECLETKNIVHFTMHSEKQANYVECFIKTLKSKLYKMVNSYNRTWHSGIRSEPINVTKRNEKQLWWQMYWPKEPFMKKLKKKKRIPYAFKVGDKVKTSYTRKSFQREYDSRWTAEIFKVKRRFMRQGQPIYTVVDWDNNPVQGTFYQKELQKVEASDKDLFKIETVLKYEGKGKNKQALVKWKGWPKKFNSWILASTILPAKNECTVFIYMWRCYYRTSYSFRSRRLWMWSN